MHTEIVALEDCAQATGTVVVIDVLRAFTSAGVAFAQGAREIVPVGTIDEAFALREVRPELLLMGERGGLPVDGFDLPNSPTAIGERPLRGATIVHRSTAGTQGLVRAVAADALFAAAFANAGATAAAVGGLAADSVTFVVTGSHTADAGDEDRACAEYLSDLLRGRSPDPAPFLDRVQRSAAAQKFLDPDDPRFPEADVARCAVLDAVALAMRAERDGDRLRLRALDPRAQRAHPLPGRTVRRTNPG